MTRDPRNVDRTIIALGISGMILLLAATRWGVGLITDSLTFVEAARNLAKGQGLATMTENGVLEPMTHWPPLYSFLIAVPGMFGIDPLVAARWINAALFAVTIVLIGAIVRRLSPGAPWVAVVAAM